MLTVDLLWDVTCSYFRKIGLKDQNRVDAAFETLIDVRNLRIHERADADEINEDDEMLFEGYSQKFEKAI